MITRWTLLVGLAATALTPLAARSTEPVEVPAAAPTAGSEGQAGLDMALTDPEGMPAEPEFASNDLPEVAFAEWSGAPADLAGVPVHHLYTDLRRALVRYQLNWGALPQVIVPAGEPLGREASGPRVEVLRRRLGLAPEGRFDDALGAKLRAFQTVHALPIDGLAGPETLAALNRGAAYYERLILLNMERARRLPPPGSTDKFIVVDAGAALLTMYRGGEAVGTMKVVVGAAKSQTPMIATQLRYAAVNPYWNVPPDLVAKLIAPKVVVQGRTYLVDRRYQVLSDWTDAATPLEPEAVNWQAVADHQQELRVRQLPGGANSMGRIKFLMPNQYGIYLHDTPNRALFGQDDRWVSNGCVRLEDADALARFVFGSFPSAPDPDRESRVDLAKPVPVYMTYLTAAAEPDGSVRFRRDPYDRDPSVLAAMEQSLGPLPAMAVAPAGDDPLAAGEKAEAGPDLLAPVSAKLATTKPNTKVPPKPASRAAIVPKKAGSRTNKPQDLPRKSLAPVPPEPEATSQKVSKTKASDSVSGSPKLAKEAAKPVAKVKSVAPVATTGKSARASVRKQTPQKPTTRKAGIKAPS